MHDHIENEQDTKSMFPADLHTLLCVECRILSLVLYSFPPQCLPKRFVFGTREMRAAAGPEEFVNLQVLLVQSSK